jgi:hypothetical protein
VDINCVGAATTLQEPVTIQSVMPAPEAVALFNRCPHDLRRQGPKNVGVFGAKAAVDINRAGTFPQQF